MASFLSFYLSTGEQVSVASITHKTIGSVDVPALALWRKQTAKLADREGDRSRQRRAAATAWARVLLEVVPCCPGFGGDAVDAQEPFSVQDSRFAR